MDENIKSNALYEDFWNFFNTQEEAFFAIVKESNGIEENFLEVISPKLKSLNENFFFLTGMFDDETAEIIITVDGNIKDIVYAEELIEAAPKLDHWRFTALKSETCIDHVSLRINNNVFDQNNIFFYSNDDENYPDEIDITFLHKDFNENNSPEISNGTFLFIDNYLGELNFATQIDNFKIVGISDAEKELIPIKKLKDFLSWRETEFTEKYKAANIHTTEDSYSILEATLENGFPLLATVNVDLLRWDEKASHPWISVLRIEYNGDEFSGLPDNEDYENFNIIEDEMMLDLKPQEGNLNIGRETAENLREIYFASKDFRHISKVLADTVYKNPQYNMTFEIYKDKYWQSFERYGIN